MSPGDRKRRLSKDERVLWSQFTRKIDPLRARTAAEPDDDIVEPPGKVKMRGKAPSIVPKSGAKAQPKPARVEPPLVSLGRRDKQRVARGRAAIDMRLDLHGMTQDEAHGAVLQTLRRASARDAKLVLIITGKSGVLRRAVPQWLSLPELRSYVIGFETAASVHGGDGALYVRVRRMR